MTDPVRYWYNMFDRYPYGEESEMNKTEKRILTVLDQNTERILAFGRDVYHHAELGYREYRTSERFLEQMQRLGLDTESGLALAGGKAYLRTGRPGPCLALLGEMDGLPMPEHPHANPETGAAHACGHHCQLAGIVGAAIALSDPEVTASLSGTAVFFAVPAEKYVDLSYRARLIREGRIAYPGGKCELIRIGAFDDVDLCMAHHTSNEISFGSSSGNGFFSKKAYFFGRAAHAAAAPENGINALSAASLALQAIGMNRESFAEKDGIRVSAVLTDGGAAPGIIPDTACIEAMVRGKTLSAIETASSVVDRCFRAGALAIGAKTRIETRAGYLPEKAASAPRELVDMARELLPDAEVRDDPCRHHGYGSSDLGDLRSILPVLQFHTGGTSGCLHQMDFDVTDEEEAYLLTARLYALSAYRLLRSGAKLAMAQIQAFQPLFSREGYCAYVDRIHTDYETPAHSG